MKTLFKFIKTIYKYDKKYILISFFQIVIKSLLIIYNTFSLAFLIYFLGLQNYQTSLLVGLTLVIINLLFNLINKYIYKINVYYGYRNDDKIDEVIMKKLMNLPFSYLEDPYYLDLKERAKMGVNNFGSVDRIIKSFSSVIENLIAILTLGSIIVLFDYRIFIILLICVIINLFVVISNLKFNVKFFEELVPINRRFGYFLDTTLDDSKAKDYRIYPSISKMMSEEYMKYEKETIKAFNRIITRNAKIESIQKILSYIQLCLIYILIALQVKDGLLNIATFSLLVSGAITFSKSINTTISSSLDLIQTISYVVPFLELMDIKEDNNSKNIILDKEIETIEFKNVTFKYPKTENIILKNVSFKINKGQKIALVGLNGSGKTTIVKLLTRLYNLEEGEILINDININDYEYKSYIKQISAVFQDFKLFAYSIKENILNKDGSDIDAIEIANKVGLKSKIESLKDGINSLYTKNFDDNGIELSGGEQQKIAIGRALYASSSLVILDEPTSALDPIMEAEIYENFNNLVQNKTAIYISHRMSSSIFSDKILVLNNGVIEDFDTHANLMKKEDSLYFKLFNAQAKNYA